MNGLLLLAWKHACFHKLRSILLVLSLGFGLSIPIATRWITADLQQVLTSRARQTPVIVGAPGSRVDLVLGSLYFHSQNLQTIPSGLLEKVSQDQLIDAVPIHFSQTAKSFPVVGTSLSYFEKRDLKLQTGTLPRRLGDCVLGFNVAQQLNLQPGDKLLSDAKGFLNPASDLPLKMRVTGILSTSHSADDRAVFVDIKTAWLMEGIGHGHMESLDAKKEQILNLKNGAITLNASVQKYQEVTDENRNSFHFHGDESTFPITAILVYPVSKRKAIIWEGRHQSDSNFLIVHPSEVVQELILLLLDIRKIVDAVSIALTIAMLILLLLLGSLSLQLRKKEMETFHAIGASRTVRVQLILLDFALVFIFMLPVALLLGWIFASIGKPFLFQLLM